MVAPVLWIWDKDNNLLFEGQFKGSPVLKTGEAYRYKHLCQDGVKEGRILTKEMIDMAIVLDTAWMETEGILYLNFEGEK